MTEDEDGLHQLARAIAGGGKVDWASTESGAVDDSTRKIIRELAVIAAISDVHSSISLPRDPHADTWLTESVPEPLETWGSFRLLEKVGEGAYGQVYRAWDTRLDREVALKLLPAGLDEAAHATSIIEEGRLLARVRHPNVVTIYGAERIENRVGLWMEFVKGRTLEQIIEQGNVLSESETVAIGLQLCRAVSAVHGAGLLHRDIKAHNVMQSEDGRIALMDFGTGRTLEDDAAPELAGTPLYLAPEVLQGQQATVRSDIYSLGVVLFHLVTGSYPVRARTVRDMRQAHERGERAAVRSARPDVSPTFARVIERAIDPQPEQRHASADALGADLVDLAPRSRIEGALDHPLEDRTTAGSSARSRWFWRVATAASILLSAFLVALASGWLTGLAGDSQLSSSIASVVGVSSRAALPAGERPVIAVQPFRNVGRDPEGNLIVDGLTYEIVGSLAALDGLDVRSAASSLASDNSADVQAFGRELGANLVLAGSVLGWSSKLRINTQLVRVADNVTVWADSFEPINNDVLAVQKDISLAIINRLRLSGLGQRRYQLNPRLSNAFLTARALQSRHTVEDATRAARLFEQIIETDPSFAPAYAGLASALGVFSRSTPDAVMPPPDLRMEPAAKRAIDLDPWLSEAHAAMGSLHARDRDWVNARASFTKAMELNPTLTSAHTEFVLMALLPLSKLDEALRVMEAARSADPMSLDVRRVMALVQMEAGLYDLAITNCRWVLERDPAFPYANFNLGRALILSRRMDEAFPLVKNTWDQLGYLYAVTGRPDEAEALAAAHPEAPARQMMIYAGLGDRERAFEALVRTADVHWWRAAMWMIRPEMAFLRDDPRVSALRKRLRLIE